MMSLLTVMGEVSGLQAAPFAVTVATVLFHANHRVAATDVTLMELDRGTSPLARDDPGCGGHVLLCSPSAAVCPSRRSAPARV